MGAANKYPPNAPYPSTPFHHGNLRAEMMFGAAPMARHGSASQCPSIHSQC